MDSRDGHSVDGAQGESRVWPETDGRSAWSAFGVGSANEVDDARYHAAASTASTSGELSIVARRIYRDRRTEASRDAHPHEVRVDALLRRVRVGVRVTTTVAAMCERFSNNQAELLTIVFRLCTV